MLLLTAGKQRICGGYASVEAARPGFQVVEVIHTSVRLCTAEGMRQRGAVIVCYCHHGVRSLTAATILRQAGFERAVSLAGGIDLWSRRIDPAVPRY